MQFSGGKCARKYTEKHLTCFANYRGGAGNAAVGTGTLFHSRTYRRTHATPNLLGVVIHSDQEFKSGPWGDERIFKVHFNNNLDAAQTGRLLDSVASYIDANLCEE